jgi:hypothetical protein
MVKERKPYPLDRRRDPEAVAKGYGRGAQKRVVIAIDDETLEQITAIAKKRNVGFATVARELLEFGLEDLKQSTKG